MNSHLEEEGVPVLNEAHVRVDLEVEAFPFQALLQHRPRLLPHIRRLNAKCLRKSWGQTFANAALTQQGPLAFDQCILWMPICAPNFSRASVLTQSPSAGSD